MTCLHSSGEVAEVREIASIYPPSKCPPVASNQEQSLLVMGQDTLPFICSHLPSPWDVAMEAPTSPAGHPSAPRGVFGFSPCSFSQARSWMKPMKGAMPVPGPIMMTGVLGLKGRRNCDFRTYMGTREFLPFSLGTLFFSQLVATPLFSLPVLVSYSTVTAQMWMELGWTCRKGTSV